MEIPTFREAVRRRPGMYFGDIRDGFAAGHVVFELVANGIDQFLTRRARRIDVEVEGRSIRVTDDGPGLPFDRPSSKYPPLSEAEEFLERAHVTPSARGHAPHVHVAVVKGFGLAALNAIADTLQVTSDNGRQRWTRRYAEGLRVGDAEVGPSRGSPGTAFRLDLPATFAPMQPDRLRARLRDQVYLYPDLQLTLNGERFMGARGLLDLALVELAALSPGNADPRTLWHRENYGRVRLHVALVGDDAGHSMTRTWVNGIETRDGGSHLQGLNRALGRHHWRPAVKLLHIVLEEPEFAGPTRDKLAAPHIVGLVERTMNRLLAARK